MKMCSVEGCDREVWSRTWCSAHYQRWQTGRDVRPLVPIRVRRKQREVCTIFDCGNIQVARGLCDKHYRRFLAHGNPLTVLR